jgi:hypothetical protein
MSEIDSKITEIIYSKCGCTDSSIEAVSMVAALIAADRAGLVEALEGQNKKIAELREALECVSMGNGPYNRDPFKHLENCYDHMIEIAKKALEVQNG